MSGPTITAPRKPRTALWFALALFWFCVFPIGLTWWVFNFGVATLRGMTEGREAETCQSRLRKVWQVLEFYSVDNDGRYPPSPVWVDTTWKYGEKKKGRDKEHPKLPEDPVNESESIFRCPSVSKLRTGDYGYAMYELLGSALKSGIKDGSKPLVFDSVLMQRDARSSLGTLPLPPRHKSSRENYAVTVDGSIRIFKSGDKG